MVRQGMFSTGLFECCSPPGEMGLCCVVWWCPCIQYGLNANRLESMRDYRTCISRDPRADYVRAATGAAGGSGGSFAAPPPPPPPHMTPPPHVPYGQPQMAYAVVNPHPHVPMAGDGAATDAVATGFPVTGVPGKQVEY
eukprot:XP_001700049.1 predicted protein [Chlamydomonas reinhardtii]